MKAADLLLRAQALPRQEFDRVLALVHQTGERAEEVMIEHEIVSEADLLKALSAISRKAALGRRFIFTRIFSAPRRVQPRATANRG